MVNQTNSIREAVDDGRTILGARCMSRDPMFVEVFGGMGFDFVWLDLEHGGPSPLDEEKIEHLTRAADASNTALLLRLPSNDPPLVRKVLDAGARTILIPRVETRGDIERAVEAAYFTYAGRPGERGVAAGRSSQYGGTMEGYPDREDESVFVGCMIEKRAAVENLDEILSVPHLGFAFLGHGDLSVSYGHPLNADHPKVREAIQRIRETCLSQDIPLGRVTSTTDGAMTAINEGYQIIRIGGEVSSIRQVLPDRLAGLRENIE